MALKRNAGFLGKTAVAALKNRLRRLRAGCGPKVLLQVWVLPGGASALLQRALGDVVARERQRVAVLRRSDTSP